MKTRIHTLLLATLALLSLTNCTTTSTAVGGAASKYPLDTCIVTDNGLESMGGSLSLVHEGQEIKFCCEPCVGKFQRNPAKYLAKLPK